MASVSVKMFATVREEAGMPSIEVEASTLGDLISKLERRLGSGFSKMLRDSGPGHEKLVLLLNGRNLGLSWNLDAVLNDGDEVAIFPPVSGG